MANRVGPFRWVQPILQSLGQMPQVLGAVWQTGRYLVLGSLVVRILLAIIPAVVLWVSKLLIDTVTKVQGGGAPVWHLLWELFLLEVCVVVVGDGLARLSTFLDSIVGDRLSVSISIRLLEHSETLDLETFENPLYQDCLDRARDQVKSQLAVLTTAARLMQSTANLSVMIVAVALYKPWLVAVQLLAILPVSSMEAYFASVMHKLYRSRTPIHRTLEYLLSLGTSTSSIKEVKAFGLGRLIVQEYSKLSNKMRQENARLARRQTLIGLGLTVFGSVAYYMGYGFLVWQASHRLISIGTLVFLSGTIQRSKWQMQDVFSSISRSLEQTMHLGDMFEFFRMEPRVRNPIRGRTVATPIEHGFEFRNVSFHYAGSDTLALNNVSFSISPGETIALVGMSGAGKTTVTKLMARLYDPTDGVILLDGVDLRDYDTESLRRTISVVFQDFVRYEFTAGVNIGVGDLDAMNDTARLDAAAIAGMAEPLIRKMPGGYNQVVGRRFAGGIDLSGGEWQKLALARACMRNAQLLILDEPSAALDIRTEVSLFEHFAELTRDKMAVLISHRFSTVRIADKIIVLENGRVREQGTHQYLMAMGGEYASLFRMQAAGYQEFAEAESQLAP